jgi:hypothetical protein
MEATGYPLSTRQTLMMFLNGLPTDMISYITLYNNIMISLNEPDNSLLLNIYQLFNNVTWLNGNITCSWLLNQEPHTHQSLGQPTVTPSPNTTMTVSTTNNNVGTI